MNQLRYQLLRRLQYWFLFLALADLLWAGWITVVVFANPAIRFASGPDFWIGLGLTVITLAIFWSMALLNWLAFRSARRLQQYSLLRAVAVFNLIPGLHYFCVGGLPIGILALVALFNRPVRDVFRAVAAGESREQALARLAPPSPKYTAADEMDAANNDWDQGHR